MELATAKPSPSVAEATNADDPVVYRRGRQTVPTLSSILVSSSPYLNDARIREWMATETLRRNGSDYPNLFGLATLIEGVDQARDVDRVETLIRAERKSNPALDRWFEERFISTYTLEELGSNPPESIGRLLYEHMVELGLSPNLDPRSMADPSWSPTYDIEYYNLRSAQTHDFDHILGEVGFDVIAEIFPTGLRMGNIFAHVSPELAGELLLLNSFIMTPWLQRTLFHYPAAWPTFWRNLSHGYEVGQQSDLLFTAKFENLLHLTPAQARDALGIRGFRGPSDSRAASRVFGEGREII